MWKFPIAVVTPDTDKSVANALVKVEMPDALKLPV